MGRRVPQQPRVGQVDQHPGAAFALAHRGVGLDVVVHLLRFCGRAGSALTPCDGQDMVGRCVSPSKFLVNRVEHLERGNFAQGEKDNSLNDRLDPVRLIPL